MIKESRFWSYVLRGEDKDCWLWQGHINENGYGRYIFRENGKSKKEYAHRIALELSLGKRLEDEECALHKCDNPPCCNPAHLFRGTRADNLKDMRSKGRGRSPKGETHPKAKLTENQVKEIRMLRMSGLTQEALAARFGMSRRSIRSIIDKKRWKEV